MTSTYLTESKFYLVENSLKKRGWISSDMKKNPTLVWLNTKKALAIKESRYCNHIEGVKEIVYKSDLAKTLMSVASQFLAPPAHALNDHDSFLRFQRDFVILLCFSLVSEVWKSSSRASSSVLTAAMDVLHLKSSSQLFMSAVPSKVDMVKYSLFLTEFGTSSSCLHSLHEKSGEETLSFSDSIRSIVDTFESKYPKALLSSHNIWILKPGASSKGNNIRVLRDFSEIVRLTARCKVEGKRPKDGFVAMRYIENPLLLPPKNIHKFDLRRWVLLWSKSPSEVEVYMLNDAYARVCATTYVVRIENLYYIPFTLEYHQQVRLEDKQSQRTSNQSICSNLVIINEPK